MKRLFVPRIWSGIVYHLNVFIDTVFASLSWIVGEGALAAIYYANRIIQFPLALIAVSLARVVIVDMADFHHAQEPDAFKRVFVFALQNILFFIIPISLVFLCVPYEILDVLFGRGEFGPESLAITSPVLFYYAWGLLFFCLARLFIHAFYSLQDTSTPARIATYSKPPSELKSPETSTCTPPGVCL